MNAKLGSVVYSNKHYDIIIDVPPPTPEFPEPGPAYVIYNKQTNVVEYYHSVFYHSMEWADHFSQKLDERENGVSETLENILQ